MIGRGEDEGYPDGECTSHNGGLCAHCAEKQLWEMQSEMREVQAPPPRPLHSTEEDATFYVSFCSDQADGGNLNHGSSLCKRLLLRDNELVGDSLNSEVAETLSLFNDSDLNL